jgi:hypothetical protein
MGSAFHAIQAYEVDVLGPYRGLKCSRGREDDAVSRGELEVHAQIRCGNDQIGVKLHTTLPRRICEIARNAVSESQSVRMLLKTSKSVMLGTIRLPASCSSLTAHFV